MHPMAKIVEGRLTLEIPGGERFTFDNLKDMHTRAVMIGLPTDATITRIAWHLRPTPQDPQQISVYYQVEPDALPFARHPEEGPAPAIPPRPIPPQALPPRPHQFPNPITTQE